MDLKEIENKDDKINKKDETGSASQGGSSEKSAADVEGGSLNKKEKKKNVKNTGVKKLSEKNADEKKAIRKKRKKTAKKTKKEVIEILDLLTELHPDAHCELVHSSPFELLIATILSAQCTDVRVNIVTEEMFRKYNTPEAFKALSIEEIESMIKTCGLYKSKAKKIKETSTMIADRFGGQVPDTLEELITLPGVGRKTAGVVLSNAFHVPAIAVDTHVFRVSNRIGIVKESTPEKTEFALMKAIPEERWSHSHHLMIFHGRRICKARKPECDRCNITEYCNYFTEI